jgi:hypothetical protein
LRNEIVAGLQQRRLIILRIAVNDLHRLAAFTEATVLQGNEETFLRLGKRFILEKIQETNNRNMVPFRFCSIGELQPSKTRRKIIREFIIILKCAK